MRTPSNTLVAVGWFPESEFPGAVERWPFLTESWGADTYRDYCRAVQGHLLNFAAAGIKPSLAPIEIEPFLRWCEAKAKDPASPDARSNYAAGLLRAGMAIEWPPGRNDRCWCGSGLKYKACCATAPRAPLPEE